MSDDEPILTAREERAAAGLRLALRAASEEWPLRVDAAGWVASVPRRRSIGRRLPVGMAAALVVVIVGAVAFAWWSRVLPGGPGTPPTAGPSLPGTPGHFDNGTFSFDYPTNWRTLSGEYYEGMVNRVYAVLGTGDWKTGCYVTSGGGACTGDTVDVLSGRIVVKVYEREGGPANMCGANSVANATLGPNEVSMSADGSATTWEIRMPGADFGWANNVFVEVWAGGAQQVTQAEALVASFRWAANVSNAGNCYSYAQSGHFDNATYSFDYPTDWQLLSGQYLATPDQTDVVLGTGTWASGCGSTGCTPVVDVAGGRVVVRVWRRIDGPPDGCMGDNQAMATFGLNAVSESSEGSADMWQIRLPGAEFGWMGNVFVEVWSDGSSGLTQAEGLVASFRWANGVTAQGPDCASPSPS